MEIKEFNNLRKATILAIAAFALITVLLLSIFAIAGARPNKGNLVSTADEVNDIVTDEISVTSTPVIESSIPSDITSDTTDNGDMNKPDHGWFINKYGYTYLYKNAGYEQFNYSMRVLDRYAESLNNIANSIPDGTRLFNIIAPVSSEFADIPREIYVEDGFYNKSQSAFASTVDSKLNDKVISVPIVNTIKESYLNGEDVFFRTDKNWTSLAAYYAYAEFCKAAQIQPYSLNTFPQIDAGEYLGRFYLATEALALEEKPDKFICYGPLKTVKTALTIYNNGTVYTDFSLCDNEYTKTSVYDIFLGITAGRYEISTTANGGSLLIIGDSSAYPIIPFLSAHYRTIDIIDPLNYGDSLDEFLKNHKYNDVLAMCYTTNATSGDFVPALKEFIGAENG